MTPDKWQAVLVLSAILLVVAISNLIAVIGMLYFDLDRILFGWLW